MQHAMDIEGEKIEVYKKYFSEEWDKRKGSKRRKILPCLEIGCGANMVSIEKRRRKKLGTRQQKREKFMQRR